MIITIIGGGPGGYAAALKAAIMGAEVHLLERSALGGTCLNQGCIPTKAYLSCSDLYSSLMKVDQFGICACGKTTMDFPAVFKRKDAVVNQLVQGVGFLLKKRKVNVYRAHGRLLEGTKVEAAYENGESEIIESDRVILATGSVPTLPPVFGFDGRDIISSDELLKLKELPASLVIVGGGVIGCEFGQFFSKLGVAVTIIEAAPSILPFEDQDMTAVLAKRLKRDKVRIYTGCKVEEIHKADGYVHCRLSNGKTISSEKVLAAIGRKANLEGLGLEAAGIEPVDGCIPVNEKMESAAAGIYAIGDIVKAPLLAHVASREAMVAVEHIMGRDVKMDYTAVPRCVYTDPEAAAVGLTEKQAESLGIDTRCGRFSFSGSGKAMVIGKTEGFVKIITDEADTIIGASIIGPHATDLLAELTLCVQLKLTARQLGNVIHPHPTLSEAIMEAAHDVHKEAVHSL